MNFTELRSDFKEVIDENLRGVNYLNRKSFRPIRRKMWGQGFKFYIYRSPSDRCIQQLRDGVLSCSNPKTFNDVFEGMVKSKDDERIEIKSVIEKASNSVSIACFSETRFNQLMYAHYAKSHTGFCIEYDYDRMLNCIDIGYFYPVIYQRSPSSLAKMRELGQAIDRCIASMAAGTVFLEKIDDLISYFIHKPNIWRYEREWRLIVPISMFRGFFPGQAVDEDFHIIEGFDCISAIYLAANIDKYVEEEIVDIVRAKNATKMNQNEIIKVYKTHIVESSYRLGRREIKLA